MKAPPFSFILEELESALSPDRLRVRPMFGSHAIYFDDKIIFILRRKNDATARDNGLWVVTPPEQTRKLLDSFPALREIELFKAAGGLGINGWLNLPETEDRFEESALELCRLVAMYDPRIGKVPKPRRRTAGVVVRYNRSKFSE